MRRCVAVLALSMALFSPASAADDSTRSFSDHYTVRPGESATATVACPSGYFAHSVRVMTLPESARSRIAVSAIDGQGAALSASSVDPNAYLRSGYRLASQNPDPFQPYVVFVTLICVKDPPVSISIEIGQATVPALGTASVSATCPSGHSPLGMIAHSDNADTAAQPAGYIFGTPSAPVPLDSMPDGPAAAPIGMSVPVRNSTGTARQSVASLICANMSGVSAVIASAPTAAGKAYEVAAVVPDGNSMYGFAAAGGAFAGIDSVAVWGTDGSVSTQFVYTGGATLATDVRGVFIGGRDARVPAIEVPPKATARAVVGMLLQPSTPSPPPATTTVVEFYNAALDHYFITASAKEIADLDSGVHKGWTRTAKSFKAYATGSSGKTTRRPVCREYGNPAVGLDSHFYSASPAECVAVLANFKGDWLLEAGEVFQMDLPDAASGACPPGGVPIYRLWNNRKDSNHRYTTTIADRDAMVAKGFIAEGYGPNSVTLCGLP